MLRRDMGRRPVGVHVRDLDVFEGLARATSASSRTVGVAAAPCKNTRSPGAHVLDRRLGRHHRQVPSGRHTSSMANSGGFDGRACWIRRVELELATGGIAQIDDCLASRCPRLLLLIRAPVG